MKKNLTLYKYNFNDINNGICFETFVLIKVNSYNTKNIIKKISKFLYYKFILFIKLEYNFKIFIKSKLLSFKKNWRM